MQLSVPHIPQENAMSCWHASARMLYAYRRLACIHPLPAKYAQNQGISADEFISLARSVGLATLPRVDQSYSWRWVEDALRRYGPLWAAGQWNGANHIVVITGVDAGGRLFVNDPAFPAPVTRDVAWFNSRIDSTVVIPLMYLPASQGDPGGGF
jgi:ABC-type bacteriocin/lantibiotic exporter with double-glycine peptidase domain